MTGFTWFILSFEAFLAFLFAYFTCWWATKIPLLDAPDGDRKTQLTAVPRTGGIGILLAALAAWSVVIGLPLVWNWTSAALPVLWFLLALSSAFSIGLLDDFGRISNRAKFALLAILSISCALLWPVYAIDIPGESTISLGNSGLLVSVAIVGTALWVFVFLNASNFMDGANGLAVGSLIIMSTGLMYLDISAIPTLIGSPIVALIPAAISFLAFNLAGRVYAGDAGAFLMGSAFAVGALIVVASGPLSVWTPATLALPFLVDVFMTLIWRVKHGQNLLHAHRDHAYQLFIRSGWGHIKTAILWWGLSLISTIAAVWAAMTGPDMAFWIFWLLLLSGISLWLWQRRVLLPKTVALESAN